MSNVILFDGDCGLCDHFVNFIIDHDPEAKYRFAPLKSRFGLQARHELGVPAEIDSVIFIQNGKWSAHSTAVLNVLIGLPYLYLQIAAFFLLFIPAVVRDWGYRFVAKRRYQWFGGAGRQCRMRSKAERARFIELRAAEDEPPPPTEVVV